jgi:hypothetical protein
MSSVVSRRGEGRLLSNASGDHSVSDTLPIHWAHPIRAHGGSAVTPYRRPYEHKPRRHTLETHVDGQIAQNAAAARIGSISVLSRRGRRI